MISVYVMFNLTAGNYMFNDTLEGFMVKWNNQTANVGYFTEKDVNGDVIIINPTNCGTINIREIKG